MDLSIYFQSMDVPSFKKGTLGTKTLFHDASGFPELEGVQIAIIGIKEDRASAVSEPQGEASDKIRDYLYDLYSSTPVKIADLGNIAPGATIKDSYHAVSDVVQELVKKNILAILIGGSHDVAYANYLAYEKLEQTVNLVSVDSRFDLGQNDNELNAHSFLKEIIMHQPNYLFNYSQLGYQTYLVPSEEVKLMDELYFDAYRLGTIQGEIARAEPVLRNADMVSVDMSSVRFSDNPGGVGVGPNGFYGEEVCQLMRYAGMSDKLSSLGLFGYNPEKDQRYMTAQLMAQMIWCAIDGFSNRKKDYPIGTKETYMKYLVHLEGVEHDIVFYKSDKSDRWWMDVPYPPDKRMKFERHHLVPCDYEDYQEACSQVVPDLWWKTYRKLN